MIIDQADASDGEPEDVLVDQDIDNEPEDDSPDPEPEGDEPEDEGEEFVVQFGDEAPPASEDVKESSVIRKLREENRRLKAEAAKAQKAEAEPVIDPGPKPTFYDDDVECDAEKFEAKLQKWFEDTAKAEKQQAEHKKTQQTVARQWQAKLDAFNEEKRKIGARDFDDAEGEFVSLLTQVQQATVIKAAKNSAAVVYALGKHPAKLSELSKITDPIELAAEVARIEGSLKMTKTSRKAPEPEGTVRGSASLSAGTDKQLEALEKEADRTNDRTKVIAYKAELKRKAQR